MSEYNGWTNYPTWRANLEIFDGMELGDFWGFHNEKASEIDVYELADVLKDYADEMLTINGESGLAVDYARAFLLDVSWLEIAKSMIEKYSDDEEAA